MGLKKIAIFDQNIGDSTRRFVLLKLTTDRHEASRDLFATAELLDLLHSADVTPRCMAYTAIVKVYPAVTALLSSATNTRDGHLQY